MKKKISILLLLIVIMPFLLGAGTGMWDTYPELAPNANITIKYYEPKFLTFLVVSNSTANTTDITTQLQSLQNTMQSQNVTVEYQIFTSVAFAYELLNNQITYRCYAHKYFLYYPGDTTCLTSTIQNFLYTEGFTMQSICSSTQYSSINSGGFFSGNGGGGYYTTSTSFTSFIQTKEANTLVPAGTSGSIYNPSMINSSSFTPSCTVTDPQNSNLTVTYTIKDANSNVKATASQNVTNTSTSQIVTFPSVSLTSYASGKYTITFETFSNPAISPVSSDPKYTVTTNTFYNAHGSNNLVTDEMEVYNKTSSDPANYNIMAERWMFTQTNIFTPNQGSIPNNGVYISSPLQQLNKSGNYQITYGVQNQPITQSDFSTTYSLFSNLDLWSTQTNQFSGTVVNRPVAQYTYSLISIDSSHYSVSVTDKSCDFDHENDTGKGIALVTYKWKQQDTLTWNTGLPTSITTGLIYEVQEQALSVDGIWSFPYQLLIGAKNPPIAQFTIANNPQNQGTSNTITDTSYTPNQGYSIMVRDWYVLDTNYNVLENCGTTQPNFTQLAAGNYIIEEKVEDSAGLWSLPCYQSLQVVNPLSVVASIAPNPAMQGQKVTFAITTTGYAKYLTIGFPVEISSLDSGTVNYSNMQIAEQQTNTQQYDYWLPINTPITLDNNNVSVKAPYVFPITAKKADGTTATTSVTLDVKGSILDGIKTEIK